MHHPVVTGGGTDGHRAARDARSGIDRAHIAGEQAGTVLRLMDGGNAAAGQTVDDGAVGPRNILNDNACHGLLLRMDRVIGATTKGSTPKKRMRICWRHH